MWLQNCKPCCHVPRDLFWSPRSGLQRLAPASVFVLARFQHLCLVADADDGLASEDSTGSGNAPRANALCLGRTGHEESKTLHVSLTQALPAVTFNCDVQCLRFVETEVACCWNAILTPWHGFRPSRCVDHGQVHEHTQAALMLCDDSALGEAPGVCKFILMIQRKMAALAGL